MVIGEYSGYSDDTAIQVNVSANVGDREGDVLVESATVQDGTAIQPVAVIATGTYNQPMGSAYNFFLGSSVENWQSSDALLVFDYKAGETNVNNKTMVALGNNSGWYAFDNKLFLSGGSANTVVRSSSNYEMGEYRIINLGSGWYQARMSICAMNRNKGDGTETLNRVEFYWVGQDFTVKNVKIVSPTAADKTITVAGETNFTNTFTVNLPDYDTAVIKYVSMDVALTAGTFYVKLAKTDSVYYGQYGFTMTTGLNNYAKTGVEYSSYQSGSTTYLHLNFKLDELERSGGGSTPGTLRLTKLSDYGGWGSASGTISNVKLTAEKEEFNAPIGKNYVISLPDYDEASAATLEMDIQINTATDDKCQVKLQDAAGSYYGNYRFTRNAGISGSGSGATATKVNNEGLIHVIFDLRNLSGGSGTPGKLTKIMDYSAWTDGATGYIANIVITEAEIEEPNEYTTTLYVEDGEDFVILNLTDFQLHDGKSTYTAFAIIDELVAETDPDLITVLGDTAEDNGNYDTTTNFVAIVDHIDSLGIPWAPIYGNHDNDNYHANNSQKSVDSEWINDVFTSAENCVFKVGPDSVNGNGNYIVNVVNRSTNGIVKPLIFVDSGVSGVDSTHVTFYEDAIEECTTINGGDTMESIVFLHIPLPEYTTLYNSGNYSGTASETPSSNGTTAFFAKIKDLGSTTHVICGHDHINSFYGEYQGVYLMYCLKSSDGDYFNDDQLGGTTFTIGAETTFEYHFLSVPYEVTFDSTSFAVPSVSNWKTSGKSISFEYKKTTLKTNGETIWFSFVAGKSRILPNYNNGFKLFLNNNTLQCGGASFEGHYTVDNIGDGWYRLTIDLEAIPLVGSVTGTETINGISFYWVAYKMLFYNAQVV